MNFVDATAVIGSVLKEYSDPKEASQAAIIACDLILDAMGRGREIATLLNLDH